MPVIAVTKPIHFWFHVAKVVGVLCDEEVTWDVNWSGPVPAPTVWTNGPYCIAYPSFIEDSRNFCALYEGTLSITATVKGIVYGPLNIVIKLQESQPT